MNLLLRLVPITFLIIFTFQSSLAESSNEKEKLVDEIVDLSGIEKQTLSLSDILEQQANTQTAQAKNLSADEKAKLKELILSGFKAERILSSIKKKMISSLSEKELKSLVKFHKQEKILKVSRLEEAASTPEAMVEMQSFAQGLAKNKPSQDRIQTAMKLLHETRMLEFMVDVMVNIIKGVGEAAQGEKIQEYQIDLMKTQMRPQLQNVLLVQTLYTYKPLSKKEFETYLADIAGNKELKKVSNIVLEEANVEFDRWGKVMGKGFKDIFSKKDKKQK
ncbi:hypothetical protein [Halobacteriovorax sp. YZS-1-1]|uniref:hypothetical protein n=1 Tax=unclassified Halobacteriovorax TaxID=2639665 RepID=UPI00399C45FE